MPRGKTSKTKYREQLIYLWAEEHKPVTVRQLFYRLSVLDAVPKNESGCKTVGRICAQMRRDGELPFEWIADNTAMATQASYLQLIRGCPYQHCTNLPAKFMAKPTGACRDMA